MGSPSSGGERLVKPGYHIKPVHDLHGLRRRRTDDHRGHVAGELPLTSMIDMFSILVIYLLMNFSATGDVFFMAKPGLVLPTSSKSNPIENAPLLSFSKGVYSLDALTSEGKQIQVEDQADNLPKIVAALQEMAAQIKAKDPKLFEGRLNLQADENTSLLYIKRAMSAGTMAGYTSINFVTVNSAGSGKGED